MRLHPSSPPQQFRTAAACLSGADIADSIVDAKAGTGIDAEVGADMKEIMEWYGTSATSDLHVFYCKEVKFNGNAIRGYAYAPRYGGPDPFYHNNVAIAAVHGTYTLAHELGHVLTNLGHYGSEYEESQPQYKKDHNLMREGPNYSGVGGSKRLYYDQSELMLKNPLAQ